MGSRRPLCASVRVAIATLAVAGGARAQTVDEARARADTLFREGQSLLDAGQAVAACPKLEESQRLDPKLGRLLNVAFCHERIGRTATAWSEYNEAAAVALQTRQADRETFARQRAGELARNLSFLRLDLSAAPEVAEITVDGAPIAREHWAVPFPIDPGDHALVFAATGRKARTQTVNVQPGTTARVKVEGLETAPSLASSSTPESSAVPAPSPQAPASPVAHDDAGQAAGEPAPPSNAGRTIGWVVGGAGIAALAVGAGFGVHAMSLRDEANPQCLNKLCNAQGRLLIDQATTAATVATVGLVVGAVAVGAGTWLVLRPVSSGASAPAGASVALAGRW
jgi:hypothetical protein